tara:strand:- start:191 stop:454 length:264 start_codon:yes stop_codon:yes gene_type:complete
MKNPENPADYFVDISADVCPMTFVKARISIEKIDIGEILEVRLKGDEPLRNVPDSLAELGHLILSLEPETTGAPGGAVYHRLRVEKR